MKRRSDKREQEIARLPEINTISDSREPVRPWDESFREFVRRLPCVVCMQPVLRGHPCHWRAKRRNGDWLELEGAIVGNLFPGCWRHHREQHDVGIESWPARYGLDLESICRAVGDAYRGGWSTDGLTGAVVRVGCYARVELADKIDGGIPW